MSPSQVHVVRGMESSASCRLWTLYLLAELYPLSQSQHVLSQMIGLSLVIPFYIHNLGRVVITRISVMLC